ncbi:N-acetylmuramoyl-L-alanine amidase family protein [Romboutsia sp.]|uniref:N-acetylmuramoyl-L-alanine amidase family protein n=1 Tax=Romboutsia sp. TaxID=1965302 RepID=UPI003F3EF874
MDKKLKKYITIVLTLFMVIGISIPTMPYAEAASNQLLIINTKTNRMGYYVNNKLVKEFSVATGKSSTQTPTGKSKIVNKIKNRPYYKLGIPGGSPRNPLGDRWMGLQIRGTYGSIYGIHGNNNESSIGKHVSGGCVRMHNAEVRWLFDRIPNNSDVILKNTNQSFKQIAASYGIKLEDNNTPTPPPTNKTGWQTIDGKKYYYNAQGQKLTGWQTIDNSKYIFNKDGVMQTGWQTIVEGRRSYFAQDGKMMIGWQKIDGKTYFLNTYNGVALRNWQVIDGKTYYFGIDEAMRTGWQVIDNNKYYFNDDGVMQTGLQDIEGKKYYFYEDGKMAINVQIDEHTTAGPDGVVVQS